MPIHRVCQLLAASCFLLAALNVRSRVSLGWLGVFLVSLLWFL